MNQIWDGEERRRFKFDRRQEPRWAGGERRLRPYDRRAVNFASREVEGLVVGLIVTAAFFVGWWLGGWS